MQSLNVKEIENVVNQYGEAVISKENNNMKIMSMEEYRKKALKREIIKSLKKSEQEIEKSEGIDFDEAFKKLRDKCCW